MSQLPAEESPFDLEVARSLPENIRFGSSSWTYPGWRGLVYRQEYKNEKDFRATCLREYASLPLFRTAGIDSTFYGPPTTALLKKYAAQVPAGFRWVSKVWERLTIPIYPQHKRYGQYAGKENEDFLSVRLFVENVLPAYQDPAVRQHTGPFVFQFPTIPEDRLKKVNFLPRLGEFLSALPAEFRYAVEIRNPGLLGAAYFATLNACGVAHCFNHWHIMPPLISQMKKAAEAGGLKANFFVARILTPLGVSYEQAVNMFRPYDIIKKPNIQMREDVVRISKRAIERAAEAFIIVNNRSEGNSPLTIDAITRMFVKGKDASTTASAVTNNI